MFNGPPPKNMEGQPPYHETGIKEKVKEKLQRVIDRGYVKIADLKFVESLMYMFHVPKDDTDIRMVMTEPNLD